MDPDRQRQIAKFKSAIECYEADRAWLAHQCEMSALAVTDFHVAILALGDVALEIEEEEPDDGPWGPRPWTPYDDAIE